MFLDTSVIAIVVLVTSFWVLLDAWNKCEERGLSKSIAVSYFVVCLLLWIVGFPAYLVARDRLGEKPQTSGAMKWILGFGCLGLVWVLVLYIRA